MALTLDKITCIESKVMSCSYIPLRHSFVFAEKTSEYWALFICEKGLVQYRIGQQAGHLQPGECVLCPPHEPFHRKAIESMSFIYALFHLQAFIGDTAVRFPHYGKVKTRSSSHFLHTVENLKYSSTCISKRYSEHLINDLLYEAIHEQIASKRDHIANDPLIAQAVRYIQASELKEGLSVQAIAEHVHMHQSQFTRKFQQEMGVSPSSYIARLRMQKMIQLLTETTYSLEVIAHECGYQNAFYLSRVFSKEMQMSPSQYRKTLRV
jgi:AraC-like DNA-binding protein